MSKTKVAIFGEEVVGMWLKTQGWSILHSRWLCKLGEIDIIAVQAKTLAFVEVKTRAERNLDFNGLLAITKTKQAKIIKTAQLFLTLHPNLSNFNCRFDVALVNYTNTQDFCQNQTVKLGEAIAKDEYQFILQEYIEGAFGE